MTAGSANDDSIREKIASVYGQLTWKGQIAGADATLVVGARYEVTKVSAFSRVNGPSAIIWTSDNDFNVPGSATASPLSGRGSYDNLLPALDFQISPFTNVITRVSFSRTIARPSYGNQFVSSTAGAGSRATLFGGQPNGTTGNPNLRPLVSDNFDVSAEWYFKPSSYLSAGFFDKRVRNFVGTGLTNGNLFGLRDATTGAAGSRSGTAAAALGRLGLDRSDINLFSYTARLIQNGGNVGQTDADIRANSSGTSVNQGYFDTLSRAVDITPDAQRSAGRVLDRLADQQPRRGDLRRRIRWPVLLRRDRLRCGGVLHAGARQRRHRRPRRADGRPVRPARPVATRRTRR